MYRNIPWLLALLCCSFTSFSQEALIPYREGVLWGLCDLQGNVKLAPQYDKVENIYGSILFRTVKGKKEGAFYNGVEVIKPTYSSLYLYDGRFILGFNEPLEKTTPDGLYIVYNKEGKRLLIDAVKDIKMATKQLVPGESIYVTRNLRDGGQVFVYNDKTQKIEQLLLMEKKGELGAVVSEGKNEIYIYHYSKSGNTKFVITYDEQKKSYKIKKSNEQVEEPEVVPRPYEGEHIEEAYQVKNNYLNRITAFLESNGKLLWLVIDKREKKTDVNIDTTILAIEYDKALSKSYIQYGADVNEYTTAPAYDSAKEFVDTIFAYRNYVLISKNNKWGLFADKKFIIPQYDSIRDFETPGTYKPYFLVGKKNSAALMKFGIIGINGDIILPIQYDAIIFNKNAGSRMSCILKIGNKYGLASFHGEIIREPQYESIIPHDLYGSFYITNNGKHGYYNDVNGDLCEPLMPYNVRFVQKINDKKLLWLIDENDNFMGYGDFDGKLYFKD